MFKVLFINFYPTDVQRGYLISSYVLKGFLQAYCKEKSQLDIKVCNFNTNTDYKIVTRAIIDSGADLVGFSCYVWNIEKIIDILRYIKPRSESKYVLGGPEISFKWIQSKDKSTLTDYAIIGPGECKLLHLVHYLMGIEDSFPEGIAYWERGKLNYTESSEKIDDLDQIPSIYLDKVIEDEYFAGQEAYLETQRGCKYRCKYCVYHKNLKSVYHYSLDRVYQELHFLIAEKQVISLRIFDSIFTLNLERAKSIIRYLINMKEEGIQLPYLIYWELMYDGIDEEFMQLTSQLKYSRTILNTYHPYYADYPQHYSSLLEDYTVINCIGIQSLNKKALKAVNRVGIMPEKLNWFMNTARKFNLVLKVDLILGLPFETFESYLEGINYILPYFEETDHILNIHRLQILPGSEMEEICKEYGVEYSIKAPYYVFSTKEFSREEIVEASKLTAILFRVLNSTLRPFLFKIARETGLSYIEIIKKLFENIARCPEFCNSRVVQGDPDDVYWNDQIFQELPSRWLISCFENFIK